jgi:hemoglobin
VRSLFERLGGFGAVHAIVSEFYGRVADDEILAPYFEHADMRRLIDHQTKFIASVMGGPASYTNEALRQVHAPHAIDRAAFEAMREALRASLLACDVSEADCAMVIEEIEARAVYVISRS